MSFEAPDKSKQASQDRKLGDEWADWDGSQQAKDTQVSAWVFLLLSGLVLWLLDVFGLGIIWLITPRLVEWGVPFLNMWLALIWTVYVLFFFVVLVLVYWGAGFLKPLLKMLGGIRWLISLVVVFGKLFAFSRDQIGHAYVLVHNRVEVLPRAIKDPGRLLLLAPRCLSRESVLGLKALKEKYGFEQVVAFGGTEARKAIGQIRPYGIIAVACERDLLVGIRDVRGRIPILAFSNSRPEGPCKNTMIDLQVIEHAVNRFLGNAMDSTIHINKEGGKTNESNN
ncbi:DUF116 domain-containing protein [bacterium]|nr:DUF116 domain-containing protein [bacterium]